MAKMESISHFSSFVRSVRMNLFNKGAL